MTRLYRRRGFWIIALVLAGLLWHRWQWERRGSLPPSPVADTPEGTIDPALRNIPLLSTGSSSPVGSTLENVPNPTPRWVEIAAVADGTVPLFREDRFPDRLRNTPERIGRLATNGRALLLRNALVDTGDKTPLAVPQKLLSQGPAGTYVVQARNIVDPALYARIKTEGGRVVSYIPNNALMVEASAEAMERIAAAPEVGSVLPNHPYFKFEPGLLARVLRDVPLPPDVRVAATVTSDKGIEDIRNLGEEIESVQRGPFGPLVYIKQPKDLVALSHLASVPLLEEARRRQLLNDRTAFILGSVTNVENTKSTLDLTGEGLLINVNDSGLDVTHPDLEASRVLTTDPSFLDDPEGHGTHVAATIAGSGAQSSTVTNLPQGSVTNTGISYQGKAPKAQLLILPIDLRTGPIISDAFLQETFARTNRAVSQVTNAPVSNNSWGYIGAYEYTSISASYDIASRDALPEDPGDQPIMYVFSAGNDGGGASNGGGGFEDTILAPGNGKNVITVGALESARQLTNAILFDTNGLAVWAGGGPIPGLPPGMEYNPTNSYRTNRPFAARTDTDYEVSDFSSRGNIGIGVEGEFGRFKPDVVAPGGFIFSARSQQWDLASQFPFRDPTTNAIYRLYDELNREGEPWYRYESGTSMAAPAISGLLAQMLHYFEFDRGGRRPQGIPVAGYKALLINSSQPTSESYNYDTRSTVNYAGWGRPNLTRALGGGFKAAGSFGSQPLVGFSVVAPDSRGLATGQGMRYRLKIKESQKRRPLSLTLAWTDPPGNPAASIKLVNNLDLIVSNTLTGEFYVGNDFSSSNRFSQVHSASNTNLPLVQFDVINNVEKVVIPGRSNNAELVITVIARQVNVNATGEDPTAIVQDSALILSAENSTVDDDIGTVESEGGDSLSAFITEVPRVVAITNGELKLNERVGANSPLIGGTNGTTNQWRFYIFTNVLSTNLSVGLTSGPNVAFVTFFPPDLARPRAQKEADIDMYVSRNPGLTNLDPTAIAGAFKSIQRGGTELVTFTNARVAPDEIFYIGIKSEDQQGGEYSFVALSSREPFGRLNEKGEMVFTGFRIRQPITDGTPEVPGFGLSMALAVFGGEIRRIYVDDTITHSAYLDLVNTLTHNNLNTVLQDNRPLHARDGLFYEFGTNITASYDDSDSGDDLGAFFSHGPGSLNNYAGTPLQGVWLQQSIDNRRGNEGQIEQFTIRALTNDFGPNFVTRTVQPGRCQLEVINVPTDATRLRIDVTNMQPALPLLVLIQRDRVPNPNDPQSADKFAIILPPGGSLGLGIRDVPPLRAGRYFIAVCNPNGSAVTYRIRGVLERDLDSSYSAVFSSGTNDNISLLDLARSTSTIFVDDSRPVSAIEVALRLAHERISDLFVHLVNPAGDRTLLAESRGRTDTNGFGSDNVVLNFTHIALSFDRADGRARLYVNARPVADATYGKFDPATLGDFIFGRDLSGRLSPSDSPVRLDDFAMWRKAMKPTEIIDLYNRGFLGDAKGADPSQAARYPFDGNGRDVTGNGADALLGGNPSFEQGQFDQSIQLGGVNGFALADNQPFQLVITNFFVTNVINGMTTVITNSITNIVRRTPPLDVGTNGFTLEGWVTLPAGDTNIVIAGWSDRTNYYAPALLVGFDEPLGGGPGSFSAALVDTNGSARFLSSRSGVVSTNPFVDTFNYAAFSDGTNRPAQVIKFVRPPFTGLSDEPTLVVESGFDTSPDGIIALGTSVENWQVYSNSVAVLKGGNPFNGTNHLVLRDGAISRKFGTAPGQKYQLTFRTRTLAVTTNKVPARFLFDGELDRELDSSANWTTHVSSFLAGTNSVTFAFESLVKAPATNVVLFGLELDGIELNQISAEVLYQPEESMKPLLGGNAFGDWKLELTDSRGNRVGEILSWQLRLTFAPTNPPVVRLTNGIPYRGTNDGKPSYFYIDVPVEATVALNTLTSFGSPLNLYYNADGLPTEGFQPTDVRLLRNVVNTEIAAVTKTQPPILPSGQRYYLEVLNTIGTDTNQFVIQVDLNVPITPLTNNVAFTTNNLAPGSQHFYSFQVSPDSTSLTFDVTGLTQDIDLYASPPPELPRPFQSPYSSQNSGVTPERIVITDLSQPIALKPGTWYAGVHNPSTSPADYTIVAREMKASLTMLSNNVPLNITNSMGPRIEYYYIDVDLGVASGRFEVKGLTAEADLYLQYDSPLPTGATFHYASTNSGILPETLVVTAFDGPVPMKAGRWLLGVSLNTTENTSYTVSASIFYPDDKIIELSSGVPDPRTGPAPGSTDYRFSVFTPANAVRFELGGLDGLADLYVARGTLPRIALKNFSDLRTGSTGEIITITTNDFPDLATDWYLTVERPAGGATNWTVTATALQDPSAGVSSRILLPTTPGGPFVLEWTVPSPGLTYQVQSAESLSAPVLWSPLGANFPGVPPSMRVDLPVITNFLRFYRVILVP